MILNYEQKIEFLKGTLTPVSVVEIIGNDAVGWADLLEFVFKSYGDEKSKKEFADTKRAELIINISGAEDWFKEKIESGGADESDLSDLADIFGWEKTKEVDVVITVNARGTLSVPFGMSVDDVLGDIEVEISTSHYSDFSLDINDYDDVSIAED